MYCAMSRIRKVRNIMIYTKQGDKGETSLVGGTRVLKCDLCVETYGTVDELNSQLGVVAELVKPVDGEYYNQLKAIQNNLFVIQTLLATEDPAIYVKLPQLPENATTLLEHHIDAISGLLPEIRSFVIPGGNLAGAQCHVARCVCRRAERLMVSLNRQHPVEECILQYINRLSDYLFVLSRIIVIEDRKDEIFWSSK